MLRCFIDLLIHCTSVRSLEHTETIPFVLFQPSAKTSLTVPSQSRNPARVTGSVSEDILVSSVVQLASLSTLKISSASWLTQWPDANLLQKSRTRKTVNPALKPLPGTSQLSLVLSADPLVRSRSRVPSRVPFK